MARYGISKGTPKGGHGGASPFTASPLPRKKTVRAARARRVRKNRRVYRRRG